MTILEAAALGLVEGITEYLPVSSTGHLIITADLLGLESSSQAVKDFAVVIQGGAILAVGVLFFGRFVSMLRGLAGKDADGLRLFINLVIAFTPAVAVGLLVHKWVEEHLMRATPIIIALMGGGVFMILVDRLLIRRVAPASGAELERELARLTPGRALFIGVLQCVALIPGTSRSMMTISGGVMAGLRPAAAAEFSFLLGMPTLLAATGYALYKNLKHAKETGGPSLFEALGTGPCIVGMLVAAVSAVIAVKWLVAFLNRHGLTPFGVYRIALGLVLIGLIAAGWVKI